LSHLLGDLVDHFGWPCRLMSGGSRHYAIRRCSVGSARRTAFDFAVLKQPQRGLLQILFIDDFWKVAAGRQAKAASVRGDPLIGARFGRVCENVAVELEFQLLAAFRADGPTLEARSEIGHAHLGEPPIAPS